MEGLGHRLSGQPNTSPLHPHRGRRPPSDQVELKVRCADAWNIFIEECKFEQGKELEVRNAITYAVAFHLCQLLKRFKRSESCCNALQSIVR